MRPIPRAEVDHSVNAGWRMPDESEPHERTWMAFGASEEIWGEELLELAQEDLARIANTIAEFERVTMLVRPADRERAEELCDEEVELIDAPLDDLWIRDAGPCFVVSVDGRLGAVDLNFNGWGEKQTCERDAEVAAFVARRAGAVHLETDVVGEGGGIEVDGHGNALVTESCFVNSNRNPELTRSEIEAELSAHLGLRKVIWLPGIKGRDITDGHTDFYARFVRPGVVVAALENDPESFDHAVTRAHQRLLRAATDADGRRLEVRMLVAPTAVQSELADEDFSAGYVNYYVCNGAVVAPCFGDEAADTAARLELQQAFPDREVVQIRIDAIAAGGGGIHCATQQQPRVPVQEGARR